MQWKKVHSNLCLQGAWNVFLQTSWWNPQDLASSCLRKFLKSLSLINSCQVGKFVQQNLSFQVSSQLQWKRARIALSNLAKKLIVSVALFGSFSLILTNLSCCERCSKCWWYCPMVKLPLKGDLVLIVNFWLKIFTHKFNCSETYPQSHAELWFVGSWFIYYTWIIGLCQFCKMLFSEREREIVGKWKVF